MLDISPLDGIRSPFGPRRGRAFSPSTLFALAEPGVWFDPSDLTTLFQDPAGTTPVTAPGNTVGLMLDKSKGLALGAELVANGDFSSATGWTTGAGWAIGSGNAARVTGSYSVLTYTLPSALTSGKWYVLEMDKIGGSNSAMLMSLRGGATVVGPTLSLTNTRVRCVLLATANHTSIGIEPAGSANDGTIDNISVRELPGNHATQATLASRPIYGIEPKGGRRNLLTYSEDLTQSVWTTIGGTTKNSALNFTFTATTSRLYQSFSLISGATYTLSTRFSDADVGKKIRPTFFDSSAGWQLLADITIPAGGVVTRTFTMANAGSFVGFQAASDLSANTSFTLLAGQSVQLELGSTATAYQRVTTQYDVTEAGVASTSYLAFDGVDDGMVTGTITPGVDKAQIFAGVRKLSDAASGIVVEHSAATGDGRFYLLNFTDQKMYWLSRGGINSEVSSSALAAPVTNVITGLGDISGDRATVRLNGTQVAQSTADQGTGNYLAYPLYIGRRGGASLPFSGRVYSLITRFGANLDAGVITNTETWVAGKTGISL